MKFIATTIMLALGPSATAQQTWVVDTSLGPGADFNEIQPAVASPVREGQILDLQATGTPGELGFLLVASTFVGTFLPAFSGPLLVSPSARILSIGAFPPSGSMTLQPTVPELGPGVEGTFLALQIAACDLAVSSCWLGNPSAAVLLDSGF